MPVVRAEDVIELNCCLLRCIGRDWHFADKPTAPGFVAYWSNNGQRLALGPDSSAANDPKRTNEGAVYAGVRKARLGAVAQDFRFRLRLPDRGRKSIPSP